MTYPREIIISTRLLREHQLSHILQGWAFMHSYTPPTPLPSRGVSYLQILTWLGPRCYLLKLTFRSGWSQCTWQEERNQDCKGGNSFRGREGSCSLELGAFREGSRPQQCCNRTQQQSQVCSQLCRSHLEHCAVPKSLVVGQAKALTPSRLQPGRAEPLLLTWWGHPNVTVPVTCFILAKVFWSSVVAMLNSHASQNEWNHAEGRLIDYGNNARSFFPLINQISHKFLED